MPAPKGNKFAVGNSGSWKMFESVEELEKNIEAYFIACDANVISYDKDKNPLTEPYTVEGLALTLGCDTNTLRNYEKAKGYEVYFSTIKRAKLKIQKQKVINGMIGKSVASVTIFDLKNNHGYKDKTETDHTTNGESLNNPIPTLKDGRTMEDVVKDIQETINGSSD